MKILWVTNMPVGDLALALGLKAGRRATCDRTNSN